MGHTDHGELEGVMGEAFWRSSALHSPIHLPVLTGEAQPGPVFCQTAMACAAQPQITGLLGQDKDSQVGDAKGPEAVAHS